MGRRRVLVLVDSAALNPATQALVDFAERWVDRVEFKFVVLRSGNLSQTLSVLGPVWQVGHDRADGWSAFAADWSPDAMFAASVGALGLAQYVDLPQVPSLLYVYDDHGILGKVTPEQKSAFAEWPDLYVAPTSGAADFLTEHFFIPAGKIVRGEPQLSARRFKQLAETDRPEHEKLVIGSIGGIDWLTGPILSIYMARELIQLQNTDNIIFRRHGYFPENVDAIRFRHSMRLLEVDSCMELVPDQGHIAEFVAGLDILAIPSWKDFAAGGILEAMSLGVPVVCFRDNWAASRTVGEAGIVVEGYDAHEMALAIHELVLDPDKVARVGMKERKRVADCFLDSDAPEVVLSAIESLAESA